MYYKTFTVKGSKVKVTALRNAGEHLLNHQCADGIRSAHSVVARHVSATVRIVYRSRIVVRR